MWLPACVWPSTRRQNMVISLGVTRAEAGQALSSVHVAGAVSRWLPACQMPLQRLAAW